MENELQSNTSITIQDLLAVLELINIAASRNAFRIEEFLTVGTIYQKIAALVEQSGAVNTTGSQPLEEKQND
jgi:hypothetical protein